MSWRRGWIAFRGQTIGRVVLVGVLVGILVGILVHRRSVYLRRKSKSLSHFDLFLLIFASMILFFNYVGPDSAVGPMSAYLNLSFNFPIILEILSYFRQPSTVCYSF